MNITVLGSLESKDPKSYDVVVDQVAAALRRQKHRVSILGVHDDLRKFVSGFSRRKPDLVFNLVETFGDYVSGDSAVAGVMDLLGLPTSPSSPRTRTSRRRGTSACRSSSSR
jgi:D-alanine-D-alanine ligase